MLFLHSLRRFRGTSIQGTSSLLPFTPSPLRNEDYMGDVFIRKARQRRDFKFVYKRKIFLHSHPWPSPDPAFNRLVYLQVIPQV